MVAAAFLVLMVAPPQEIPSPELARKAEAIYWKLNCPVCAGQNVAESNSPVAKEMRALVRQMLREGKSEREILDYFVQRYGEWILAVPPARGVNRLLWWLPVLILAGGGAILYGFYRFVRRQNPAEDEAPPPPPEVREKIQRLLHEQDE